MEKVPNPVRGVTFTLEEVKNVLETVGVDVDNIDLKEAATIFRPNPFPAGKENILKVWRDGKQEFYQLDPELYRATLALDKEAAGMFMNLLSKPAALLRAGATLSPDFMVRNPTRDMWTALVYSKYGYKPQDFAKGLFSILKKDDLYWQFKASGAAHGAMVSLTVITSRVLRGIIYTDMKDKAKSFIKHPSSYFRHYLNMGKWLRGWGVWQG